MLHGAGSTPEFMQRTFGQAAASAGFHLRTPDVSGLTMGQMVDLLRNCEADVIGGVSLGAHAAALYAARSGWPGPVYAVMPAWIGDPGPVAALTAHTAERLRNSSVTTVLRDVTGHVADDWIADELVRAWSTMSASRLAEVLRVAADQPAPTVDELRAIQGAVTVIALADDPTHPWEVAAQWATATGGVMATVPRFAGGHALAELLPEVLGTVSGSP